MYVIAVLNILKIYQFRHPDVISNGYKVFFGLGLVLFLEVVGIYYPSRVFWIVVLAIYFLILVLVTGIVYHSGKWSFNLWVFLKIFQSLFRITTTRCQCSENYSSQRLVFVFLLNGINLTFLVVGAIFSPVISTLLLTVFVGNLLVYSVYYFIMKLVHREPFTATPIVFALLALAMWACAFYFYLDPAYETELSPAESRNLNSECLLLKMSDSHDFWHLFGAGGMFSCFMLLLSLDDGLFYVPRTKIRVF